MMSVEQALAYAATLNPGEPAEGSESEVVATLAAAVTKARAVCTEDRRIRWDDGSCSVSVLDPADVLRALGVEA